MKERSRRCANWTRCFVIRGSASGLVVEILERYITGVVDLVHRGGLTLYWFYSALQWH